MAWLDGHTRNEEQSLPTFVMTTTLTKSAIAVGAGSADAPAFIRAPGEAARKTILMKERITFAKRSHRAVMHCKLFWHFQRFISRCGSGAHWRPAQRL